MWKSVTLLTIILNHLCDIIILQEVYSSMPLRFGISCCFGLTNFAKFHRKGSSVPILSDCDAQIIKSKEVQKTASSLAEYSAD